MVHRNSYLNSETEKVQKEMKKKAGRSVSPTLKRGILVLRDEVSRHPQRSAFKIYQRLDLGPGGYTLAPSTDTRRGMQFALLRNSRR
jgi:hypothetical protein